MFNSNEAVFIEISCGSGVSSLLYVWKERELTFFSTYTRLMCFLIEMSILFFVNLETDPAKNCSVH